jgi:hypothetical protein
MTKQDITTVARHRGACTGCRAEVPVSEALVAEAVDYVMHFCGLACYAEWAKQRLPGDGPPRSASVVARG